MQGHRARLLTEVELQHGSPPKVPCAAQEGPATPTHAWIQPSSKQGGQPLLSQVGARSGVGLVVPELGCSTQWLPKPQVGNPGEGEAASTLGVAIRAAP